MSSNFTLPNWLDKVFIERALREGEKNDKIKVSSIHVRPATSAGDNYSSVMFRVTAEYDVDGKISTTSLIVKSLPESEEMKNAITKNDSFPTESEVLRKLMPSFHRLLNTGTSNTQVTLAPKCYYQTSQPDQILVMEDLCQSGFKMAERSLGLDLDHSKLAVSRLGVFHAASIALHRDDPRSFDNFLVYPHIKSAESVAKVLKHTISRVAEDFESRPEVGQKYSEKLRRLGESLIHRLKKTVERDERGFNVLNHGDAWTNNMMFRYGKDGQVSDFTFVDFQLCYYSSPAVDLLYFLYSSPTSEVRSLHFNQLLECYHSSLSETLTRLGCGDQCPSLEETHEELEKRGFMSVFTTFALLPITSATSDNVPDLGAILNDRNEADSKSFVTAGFAKEILSRLAIFDRKGLLD